MKAIIGNLRQLTSFRGRERRARFWPYVGFVFAAIFILQGIFSATLVTLAFSSPPPDAPMATGPLAMLGATGITCIVAVALLAAAVSRRLHDSDRAGYWGLMPLPFLALGMVGMSLMMANFGDTSEPDMRLFGLMFANNGLYMATLIALIVLLCRPSTKGANRYGEEPA